LATTGRAITLIHVAAKPTPNPSLKRSANGRPPGAAQFGRDSNEYQSLGKKKKSEFKSRAGRASKTTP
jgi:hypothetical protein